MTTQTYAQRPATSAATERARQESYESQDAALDELLADAFKTSRKARRLSRAAEEFLESLQDDRL
ncbi:hypothetical protein [Streptomyces griseus]|uniref:hypothetical protein n=1 Tax=Streptomyces griseus TaxID=1911 RepID=UPI0033ECB439